MTTGFMRTPENFCSRNCKWLFAGLLPFPVFALAASIGVIGVFPGKGAVLVIDGGRPQSVRIGHAVDGVRLISVDKKGAVLEESGKRREIPLGQHTPGPAVPSGRVPQVTLAADGRGHFIAECTVNGSGMRFLVDTGATMVAIPGTEARRIGLNFAGGRKSVVQTANGPAPAYQVKLDSMKIGEIELLNVDAVVLDGGGLPQPLLGMSFLNRIEMRNEGGAMTLKRRF